MFTIFSLYKGHLVSSKKIILYCCIGLIIALSLLSSTMYFIDTSRQQLIDQYFNNSKPTGNDITVNIIKNFSPDPTLPNEILNSINQVTNQYQIDFINHSQTQITTGLGDFHVVLNFTSNQDFIVTEYLSVFVFQLNPSIQSEIQKLYLATYGNTSFNFPVNNTSSTNSIPNAFLLYTAIYYYTNVPLVGINKGNFSFSENSGGLQNSDYTYTVNATNILNFEPEYGNPYINTYQTSKILSDYPYLYSLSSLASPSIILFVSDINQFSNIVQKRIDFSPQNETHYVQNYYCVHMGFDYSKINLNNIGSFITNQYYYQSGLTTNLMSLNINQVFVNLNTLYYFQQINYQINNLTGQVIVLLIPSLLIAILLSHFAFSLIFKNLARNIGIYKTRGASSWIIFGFQIFDILLIVIFSILCAVIIGEPISALSLKTDSLLSFNYPSPNNFVFNIASIVSYMFYIAIMLELIVNTNRIRKLSRLTKNEAENPSERDEPYWKRHYIDIILIFYSLIVISIFYFISTSNLFVIFYPIITIIILLLLPSPFALVIGLILLLSRLVPFFLNRTSRLLWKISGNLTALSFKNIIRYKNTTIRGILITASIIAFLTLFYTQPYSMFVNYQQNAYYQSGAEGVVQFPNNQYDASLVQVLQNNFSSYITSICPYVITFGYTDFNDQLNFLFINTSTYLNSSYLNFDLGTQNNIINDFKNITLTNATTPLTPINILIDQQELKQRDASIGSNITVTTTYQGSASIQRFKIIDSFVNWPLLKANSYFGQNSNFYAIADINYFLHNLNGSTQNSIFSGIQQEGILINFKDSANLTYVSDQIQKMTPLTFTAIPKLDVENYKYSFELLSITGVINLNVIISMIVIVVVFLLYIQFQIIERTREMYTERALGMKLQQLAFMFYVENLILAGFSIIFGNVVGILFTYVISFINGSSFQQYPQYQTLIPYDLLFITDLIILLISIILSIIPALFIILKQDISEAFAGEV